MYGGGEEDSLGNSVLPNRTLLLLLLLIHPDYDTVKGLLYTEGAGFTSLLGGISSIFNSITGTVITEVLKALPSLCRKPFYI